MRRRKRCMKWKLSRSVFQHSYFSHWPPDNTMRRRACSAKQISKTSIPKHSRCLEFQNRHYYIRAKLEFDNGFVLTGMTNTSKWVWFSQNPFRVSSRSLIPAFLVVFNSIFGCIQYTTRENKGRNYNRHLFCAFLIFFRLVIVLMIA